jgi:TetR/AcrR family transcriptional regulator
MRQAPKSKSRAPRNRARTERRPQQRSLDTREIAQRAGVALAALPYHFTTKEALWRAAADRIFALLNETFGRRFAGLEGVDTPTRLRLILRDFVRFAAAHPELHRFMIQEGMRRSQRLEWLVETHVRPMYAAVRGMVEAAQREGMAPLGRPEHLHYMLIGAASSAYALSAEFELLTGTPANQQALVDEHVAALERMFFPRADGEA